MNFEIVFRPTAEKQIKETHDWYEERRLGLGEDFLLTLDAVIMFIQRSPLAFQFKYKNIRCALIPRFPYGVFYFVEEESIIITALLHMSRSPKNWKG